MVILYFMILNALIGAVYIHVQSLFFLFIEPCSTIQCPSNSRCVVHTSTGSTGLEICLPSCFQNNGGCGADQLCIVEHDGSCTNTPCSSVKCTEVQGQRKNNAWWAMGMTPVQSSFTENDKELWCMYAIADYYASRCPAGKQYKECGTACPTTCETFGRFLGCPSACVEGCFCPEGLVEYRDRCVDPLECPTLLDSKCHLHTFQSKHTTNVCDPNTCTRIIYHC